MTNAVRQSAGPFALFSRAVRLRCPNCGKGRLFASWFRMRAECPDCHIRTERDEQGYVVGAYMFIRTERDEQGYVVGAYMFNIIAAELVWVLLVLAVALPTWPDPPWNLLLYGGGLLMLVLPFLFYPFSKTVFFAFDLFFRPVQDEE